MTSSWRVVHFDEDERVLRRAAAALETEHDGVEVFTTTDADAVLDRLASESVDCVVTEFVPSVLQRLATAHPEVPRVLCTAVDDVPVEALTAGVTAVVRKGDGDGESFAELARRVADVVKARGSDAAVARHAGVDPSGARELFATLLAESTDVVAVIGSDRRFEYVSPAVERMLGYEPDDLVGEDSLAFVHPDDRDRSAERVGRLLDGSEPELSDELRLRHADGSWVWVENRGRDLRDDPAVGGVAVYTRDVTERTRRKRELERQNERLDTFTSIVSHDLRGPLSVAEGNLELAKAECDSDRLDAVARAHDRMEALIDGLLTVARQGTPVDDPEPVDVDAVARQSWEFVETGDATVEVDAGLVVRADEQRLRQLFENLFRNSVEHNSTSSRSGTDDAVEHGSTGDQTAERSDDTGDTEGSDTGVQVRVGSLDDGAGFYVEDDGPGIPPEDRDDVFEAGYSTKPGGTGLGLMILQEIADAHDWELALTEGSRGGARVEVRDVSVCPE
jgi:PAS domain S-box-containing protein